MTLRKIVTNLIPIIGVAWANSITGHIVFRLSCNHTRLELFKVLASGIVPQYFIDFHYIDLDGIPLFFKDTYDQLNSEQREKLTILLKEALRYNRNHLNSDYHRF